MDDDTEPFLDQAFKTIGEIEMARIRLRLENERTQAALETCQSWIDRWTQHVGSCEGGDRCTCGRTAVLYEAGVALGRAADQQQMPSEGK